MTDNRDWPSSALAVLQTAFTMLTATRDKPIALDCDRLGDGLGLPAGEVALPDLRTWLLAHPTAYAARDAVWRELILQSRLEGPDWAVAAAWMAMPALVGIAASLSATCPAEADDLDSAVLTGFLDALRDRVDLARPAPYAGLCQAARRAGHARRPDHATCAPVGDIERAAGARAPHWPYGHPDLLVRRAAALGVIDEQDVEPFCDVRLGHRAIEPIAARLGVSVDCLRMRLARVDAHLTRALAGGTLTGVVSREARQALAGQAARRTRIRDAKARPRPATLACPEVA